MRLPVYLDYSATTPVDRRVAEKMIPFLTEHFGNAASRSHAFGWKAEEAVEEARAHVAALLNADPKEIVWTSGATEGNNLAIKGAANFYKTKGKHIITQKTEHKAVLDTFRELERQGFEATYLEVDANGLISLDQLKKAIRADTILVSIMMVNNEIGVVQPVWEIADLCRSKGIIFHCDAVQGADALRAVDLVRGDGEQVDLELLHVDLDTPRALHRVAVEDDALRAAQLADLPDRLHYADLVVHHHDRDQDGVRTQRGLELVHRDQAIGIHFEIGGLEALALELAEGVEHGLVLGLLRLSLIHI